MVYAGRLVQVTTSRDYGKILIPYLPHQTQICDSLERCRVISEPTLTIVGKVQDLGSEAYCQVYVPSA